VTSQWQTFIIFSEFYPQDGGKKQMASKLRHCYSMCAPSRIFFRLTGWLKQNYGCFLAKPKNSVTQNLWLKVGLRIFCSAKESPNVVIVEHWKIRHAVFNVLFSSVFSRNVLLTISEKNFLSCLAKFARLPSKVSSYHVCNWWRDQKAAVHRQLCVACVSRTMTKAQL